MAERRWKALTPVALLVTVSVLSLAARVAWLGQPCRAPCRSASDHVLIFDESYYVNAARVIAGERPPPGQHYADSPLGDDPNAEHPQLAKLIIAGSIELFGDGPFAWRIGSIVFGSIAILGMFALARAAGGGPWMGLAAAGLMATDNLLLVHGRIGTLDIYALAAMLWGAVLYLRGRPISGGAVIGIGTCFKLVAPYALLALALFEALRVRRSGDRLRPLLTRLAACVVAAAGAFAALLAILDRVAPPYDPTVHKRLAAGPLHHFGHMLSYAAHQTSPHGPTGIASYPWTWLVDYKPIVYLNINPARPSPGLSHIHPASHFLGMINPATMLLAVPALGLIAWMVVSEWSSGPRARVGGDAVGEVPLLALAWFLGTFLPFLALSVFWSRTSYLYYMVVVMPGLYLGAAWLLVRLWSHERLMIAWMVAVVVAAIALYPFTPLP